MRQSWYTFPLGLLLVALMACMAFAGNGKISGVVKSADGQSVIGANVVIEGMTLGASVDMEGKYFILNVPPGTYRLRASAVGFARKVVVGVVVGQDQIVTIDFTMTSEAVGMEEVVIQSQRPIVDKSLTASKSTLTADDIGHMPIRDAVGLVATSASAFNGFIRGGRINESKTIVDGVDISDQFYAFAGEANTPFQTYNNMPRYRGSELSKIGDISFSSVEQMSVNTGAVGAEYSSATAGIINYSLREGRGALRGNVQARVSQFKGLSYNGPDVHWNDGVYFSERDLLKTKVDSLKGLRALGTATPTLTADSALLSRYSYTTDKYATKSPQIELEGSVSGDIMQDWGFYFTGKYFNSYGRLPGELNRQASLTLKSQYNISGDIKLTGFGIVTDRGMIFGWKNRAYSDAARFFLEGVPRTDGADVVGSLKLTHVLNPSSFYEIQLSVTSNVSRSGYTDGNGDGYCAWNEDGDFIKLETLADANKYISNSDLSKFFRNQDEPASTTSSAMLVGNALARLARPAFFYEDFHYRVLTLKGDYTNQITSNHRLQAGAQARLQDVSMVRRASYLGAVDAKKQYYTEDWDLKPTEMGFYLQDRMEYAGLIINLGARVDTWNPDAMEFTNYFAPYLDLNMPIDTLPGVQTTVKTRLTQRSKEVKTYVFFSPRIGVSHPVSDVAAMYFSYSRNAMPPPYSRMYYAYDNFGNTALPSNPSVMQEPYRSNNYELGVQWEFLPKFGLNFNAYLRDIENYGYASFNVTPRAALGINYNLGFSAGYADSRGVEITLEAQRQNYFGGFLSVSGKASYTYSYIKAAAFVTGTDAKNQTVFSQATDSTRLAGGLPISDFNFYNKIQTDVAGGASTLTGGYDRAHRITYQMILGFPADITLSSIGTFQSGFFYPLSMTDPRVAGREYGQGPWNKQVDVRIEKGFSLDEMRIALFVDIVNVFDWKNIVAYDASTTGTALWETSNKAGDPDPTGTMMRPISADGSLFYGVPREIYFGARLNF
jgi:outer membrane receptor protein involved in Fe transport